jgi:peptidoglycan LD-endopeptidase LytH
MVPSADVNAVSLAARSPGAAPSQQEKAGPSGRYGCVHSSVRYVSQYRCPVRRNPPAGRFRLAVIVLAVSACDLIKLERTEQPDSSEPVAAVQPLADTLTALPAESLVAEPDQVRVDRPAGDTIAIIASRAELAALQRQLIIPVQGVRPADLRDDFAEVRGGSRPHDALDIQAPRGTPVLSAASGRLLKLHNSVPGGLMVYAADASDRFILLYGHLDRYADGLTEGMTLRQGQVLGYVGTSGNAPPDTPHLHFAVLRGRPTVSWSRGTAVNPYPLLTGRSP